MVNIYICACIWLQTPKKLVPLYHFFQIYPSYPSPQLTCEFVGDYLKQHETNQKDTPLRSIRFPLFSGCSFWFPSFETRKFMQGNFYETVQTICNFWRESEYRIVFFCFVSFFCFNNAKPKALSFKIQHAILRMQANSGLSIYWECKGHFPESHSLLTVPFVKSVLDSDLEDLALVPDLPLSYYEFWKTNFCLYICKMGIIRTALPHQDVIK